MKTRMLQILSVMMALGLVLSACQPQVVEVEKEVVVTQVVKEQVEVEVEKVVEVEVEKIVEVEVEVEKVVEVEKKGVGFSLAEIGPAETSSVTVGIRIPNVGSNAPLYVAVDQGFYAEEGLEVEIIEAESVSAGLVGGSLQFAIGEASDAVNAAAEGTGLEIVAGYRNRQPFYVAVGKDIETPADLEGKDVLLGGTPGSLDFDLRASLMKDAGFDITGVNVNPVSVPGGSNAWVEQLLAGNLSASVFFARHRPGIIEAGHTLVLDTYKEWPNDSVVAHKDFVDANPNTVARFIRATLRGMQIWKDPSNQAYVQEMMPEYGFRVKEPEYLVDVYQADLDMYDVDMGLDRAAFADMLSVFGMEATSFESYTDVSALHIAQSSLGIANRPLAMSADQVFTVAIGKDTGPLNPHNYASLFGALTMVYEPLVVYNADGSIGPGLAESWEVSDDGLTWTFNLRQGVTFHDGTPFDADAVKWNLEKWVGTDGHSWLPTTNIVGSIDTPDDHTVVLNNTEFYYAAIQDLALVRPVRFLSPSSADADGNFVSAVGTGPWKVDEYTTDQRTTFVPHEDYWGQQSRLEKVVLEVISDPQTRIAALLSGEVNLIGGEYLGGISLESIPVLERNEDVQVVTGVGSTSYWVMMNYHRSPFDDVKVRQAINHAIDRETISTKLFRGLAAPAHGVFSPNIPYVTQPRPELYDLNLDQSQALLAEAGWTPGADGILEKDGQPFEVSMLVDADVFPQAKSIAEVMQGTLGELGIDMEIRLLDFGGWSEALQNGDYDMATNISWGAPYDPHSSLSGMFTGGYLGTEGTIYADPVLDEMIADVVGIRDEDERQAGYDAIWTYMDENAAVAPIVYSLRVYALDGTVDGWKLPGTEYDLDLNNVSIVAR